MKHPFVDLAEFTARAGDGGDGCRSFQSRPYEPRGGPDGGNGGAGGDVVLEADDDVATLAELSYQNNVEAEPGTDGGPDNRRGARGEDRVVSVPPGTVVYRADSGEKMGELTEDGDRMTVAHGGEGGRGNRAFMTSDRQTPRFRERGARGEEVPLRLEMKLIADVGLVGAPNAGKSTLLSKLTAAHPTIAEHPFTTQVPNLGVLFLDHERLTLCDIPGLIEDAHRGAGLGIDFLRHAERTDILLHVVDLSADSPVRNYRLIREELRRYDPTLGTKPTVVALNKIDRVDPRLAAVFRGEIDPPGPVVGISAREGTGLRRLSRLLMSMHGVLAESEPAEEAETADRVVRMEPAEPINVRPMGDRFLLTGERVEELVQRFDLRNPDAQSYVRERLLDMELHKKLERAGCKPGDTIQVGNQVFDYTG